MRIPEITPLDLPSGTASQQRWDSLIKPRGSLGRLEEIVVRLCEIQQTTRPDVKRKKICVFAGDHGVVAERVTAYPQSVTREMVRGFLGGYAAIGVLARSGDIDLQVVDAGICEPLILPGVVNCRAGAGTRNFVLEPAMTSEQLEIAVQSGMEIANLAAKDGVQLLAGGDMGIGNTASASALYAALFQVDPAEVTGYGAGVDEEGRQNKIRVIRRAFQRWDPSGENALE